MDRETADREFNRIYDRTYRKVAAYLTARCRSLSDVEDLIQETYLAVYRVIASGAVLQNEEAYAVSVAKTKLTDWLRKNLKEREYSAEPAADRDDWLASVPDDAPQPHERIQNAEAVSQVRALLDGRDEQTRQAFYLHHCFGLSFAEIGGIQNRNESTVRSGVFRAVQDIRSTMGGEIS